MSDRCMDTRCRNAAVEHGRGSGSVPSKPFFWSSSLLPRFAEILKQQRQLDAAVIKAMELFRGGR